MTRHSDHRVATSVCVALAIVMIGIAVTAASPMLLGDQTAEGNASLPFAHDRDQPSFQPTVTYLVSNSGVSLKRIQIRRSTRVS